MKKTVTRLFAFLLCTTVLFSCKKDDPYDFKDTIAANVNLINASPDVGSVSLFVENILRTPAPVTFGTASGYNKTLLGSQKVEIKSASGEATLISTTAQLDANGNYTYMLIGPSSAPGMLTITDDLTAPSAGKAKIRFVNASPNAADAVLLFNNGSAGFSNQNYRGISNYIEVAPGTYAANIAVGTSRSERVNVTLESGRIYTIYARGSVGGTGTNALLVSTFINK